MTNRRHARRRTGIVFITVLATVFVPAGVADARTYQVSAAGSDDHAGTEVGPFETIRRAADRARAGDPESFDLHLKPDSPAIDAGADLRGPGVTTDIDGDSRPQGKTFDTGAD